MPNFLLPSPQTPGPNLDHILAAFSSSFLCSYKKWDGHQHALQGLRSRHNGLQGRNGRANDTCLGSFGCVDCWHSRHGHPSPGGSHNCGSRGGAFSYHSSWGRTSCVRSQVHQHDPGASTNPFELGVIPTSMTYFIQVMEKPLPPLVVATT
jgi:hypothetical protein